MFMYWLLEQEDRDNSEANRLNQIILRDYNNGCLITPGNVKEVLTHFRDNHSSLFLEVRKLFVEALRAYDKEVSK